MKKIVFGLILILPLVGCTAGEKGAVIGGASGAAIGAAVAGNSTEGAIVGGLIGAAAGALIGKSTERRGYCEYRDRRGRIYVDRCPSGY